MVVDEMEAHIQFVLDADPPERAGHDERYDGRPLGGMVEEPNRGRTHASERGVTYNECFVDFGRGIRAGYIRWRIVEEVHRGNIWMLGCEVDAHKLTSGGRGREEGVEAAVPRTRLDNQVPVPFIHVDNDIDTYSRGVRTGVKLVQTVFPDGGGGGRGAHYSNLYDYLKWLFEV